MGLLKRVISGMLSLVLAVSVMQFPILSVYAEGEPTTAGTDEGLNQSDTAAGNAGGSAGDWAEKNSFAV